MTDIKIIKFRELIQEELSKFFDNSSNESSDKLLSRDDAAEVLGVKSNTLAVWAMKGTGPAPTKVGTRSMYRRCVLDAYINDNTMPR